MNHRRRALVFSAAGWPLASAPQSPRKVYRVGYLSNGPGIEARDEAFPARLRKLGYVDGKNVVIEWRFNKGKVDRNPDLAAHFFSRCRTAVHSSAAAQESPSHRQPVWPRRFEALLRVDQVIK